jgi:hypothetical protein
LKQTKPTLAIKSEKRKSQARGKSLTARELIATAQHVLKKRTLRVNQGAMKFCRYLDSTPRVSVSKLANLRHFFGCRKSVKARQLAVAQPVVHKKELINSAA